MKGLLAALFAVTGLAGCVVVPVEPVYVAPPPAAVVVRPYRYYHYHHYPAVRHWR